MSTAQNLYATFAGYLIQGDRTMLEYAFSRMRPEFFAEPFFADLFALVSSLYDSELEINPYTVCDAYLMDDSVTHTRVEHARSFLKESKSSGISTIHDALLKMFAQYTTLTSSGAEFGSLVQSIIRAHVTATGTAICNECILKISDPLAMEECFRQLRELSSLLERDSWRNSILDLDALRTQEPCGPLIQRGEEGLIYRRDVHMISGAPGAQKSKIAMCIAAAALNDGLEANRTLGMFSTVAGLRVAVADTELNNDTIRRRLPLWEAACGRRVYDQSRFVYVPLAKFNKTERLNKIEAMIRYGGFDIVIVDGLRDLAIDFNDSKEASNLADLVKRLAETSNVAIVVTSHTTKGTDYSRGHLGSQFRDLVSLELVLRKKATDNQVFEVVCTKSRHSLPENYTFRQADNTLVECDNSELTKSRKTALELFQKYLIKGRGYRYSEIVGILMEHGVSQETAKKYLRQAKGVTLMYSDKMYILPEETLLGEEDLPEGVR